MNKIRNSINQKQLNFYRRSFFMTKEKTSYHLIFSGLVLLTSLSLRSMHPDVEAKDFGAAKQQIKELKQMVTGQNTRIGELERIAKIANPEEQDTHQDKIQLNRPYTPANPFAEPKANDANFNIKAAIACHIAERVANDLIQDLPLKDETKKNVQHISGKTFDMGEEVLWGNALQRHYGNNFAPYSESLLSQKSGRQQLGNHAVLYLLSETDTGKEAFWKVIGATKWVSEKTRFTKLLKITHIEGACNTTTSYASKTYYNNTSKKTRKLVSRIMRGLGANALCVIEDAAINKYNKFQDR